jgi:outer membrane receptor for ferrienterochelin and colicin
MSKICITVLFLCIGIYSFSQRYTLSGYISDEKTNEKIIGANIYVKGTTLGTLSNPYGFYSLTLPEGKYEVSFSFVGYATITKEIDLTQDQAINISLDQNLQLGEVTVVADKIDNTVESSQLGAVNLSTKTIKSIPALLGEVDIIKAIQLLPGIQSGTEGSSGLYVRGGGPDQNLILLDGIPVYNVNHLFGFFSVFNADAINSVQLIKGGFPARYGGRLSSVIDIRMKEGNNEKIHGSGSIGLVAAKLTLEGPIIKDKMSFVISGRRTYIDILAAPFIAAQPKENGEKFGGGYYFYDLNTKLNYKFSERNRLYLSAYLGNDKAYANYKYDAYDSYSEDKFKLRWGNIISALRWNYLITNKLFLNTTLSYSRYKFLTAVYYRYYYDNKDEVYNFEYNSGIEDFAAKFELDFMPSPNHYIRFGANNTYHTFNPGVNVFNLNSDLEENIDTVIGSNKIYGNEIFAYLEDEITWNKLKINVGVHGSGFYVKDKFYFNIEPRLSARYLINKKWSVKAAYSQMNQYIHLLTNANVGLPTDLWLPVTDTIKPQNSVQYALGTVISLGQNIDLSLEGYYKEMNNLIEYKEGASYLMANEDWQKKVEIGKGNSYGAEVLLRKKTGKTTGWIGYTLSWTNRQFDNISFGEEFPAKYDRRHDISIVVSHKFSKRFDIGCSWIYGSGYATTLAYEKYLSAPGLYGHEIEYFGKRNDYRLPSYHLFDIGFNFHKQKKWGKRTWSFGAYNAYNRKNPFFLYFDYEYNYNNSSNTKVIRQVSLFPIIPYINYQFTF